MRRAILAALLVTALPSGAGAKDMNGRFALGGAQTLAGVGGLDVVYWAGRLGLDATVNIGFASPDGGDSDLDLRLAAGAFFPFVSGDQAELSIGGRVNIGTGGGTQLSLEAPLRLEWYVSDHFSLHGEVGVVVDVLPDEGRVFGSGPAAGGTGIAIGAATLTGGGGFSVIF